MHRPVGEEELKKVITQLHKDFVAAMQKAQPAFRDAFDSLKAAAVALRDSMVEFGITLNEAMEKWSEEGGDGAGVGPKN